LKFHNQEIWLAYPSLVELSKCALPVETSLGVASLINSIQKPYIEIEHKRRELVRQYGDTKNNEITVHTSKPKSVNFVVAFGELLEDYCEDDITIERVKLPSQIEISCPSCGDKLHIDFIVEPHMVLPLVQHFIET